MSEIERMREVVRRFEMAHEALLDAIDLIPVGAMKLVAASAGTARYWLDDAIQTISSELRKAERAALRSKTGHADTHPLGGRRADHAQERAAGLDATCPDTRRSPEGWRKDGAP